jgi:arabinofuranan 3-O-arabinosyltransferase
VAADEGGAGRPAIAPSGGPTAAVLYTLTAAVLLVHQATDKNGMDFRPLWDAAQSLRTGAPVYDDVRFLYPPGSALVLVPLTLLDQPAAFDLWIALLSTAGVAAAVLACRVVGFGLLSRTTAGVALATALSPALAQTLSVSNAVAFVAALLAVALQPEVRRSDAALGTALGLSLVVKPMLVPVLLLLAIAGRWRALGWTALVAAVPTAVGLALAVDAGDFLGSTLPFLLSGQDVVVTPADASLVGMANRGGWPAPIAMLVRLLVLAVGVWAALRLWSRLADDGVRWAVTSGVLLVTAFLSLVVAFDTYALLLLPLLAAGLRERSPGDTLLWLGAAAFALPLLLPYGGDGAGWFRFGTVGFVAYAAVLVSQVVRAARLPHDPAATR